MSRNKTFEAYFKECWAVPGKVSRAKARGCSISRLLSLGIIDILSQVTLCHWGLPCASWDVLMYPRPLPMNASSISPPQVVTTKSVVQTLPNIPRGANSPGLRSTGLTPLETDGNRKAGRDSFELQACQAVALQQQLVGKCF